MCLACRIDPSTSGGGGEGLFLVPSTSKAVKRGKMYDGSLRVISRNNDNGTQERKKGKRKIWNFVRGGGGKEKGMEA